MGRKFSDLFSGVSQGRIGRRDFLSRMALVPGGAAAMAGLAPMLVSNDAEAQLAPIMLMSPYRDDIRDYRWGRMREMMKKNDIDVLVVPRNFGDGVNLLQYADYLSNAFFMNPGAVIFPKEGEPAMVGAIPLPTAWIKQMGKKLDSAGQQMPISEYIVDTINDMGFAKGRVGVVGTKANSEGLNEFMNEGFFNYATMHSIQTGLPDADFEDVTEAFGVTMMVKHPKEIDNIRKSALIGEDMHAMLLDTVEIGKTTDKDMKVAIFEHLIRNNAYADVQAFGGRPGPVKAGTVFTSEYGIVNAGGYSQVTLSIAYGEVSDEIKGQAAAAEASLNAGMAAMKPGVTFGSVIDKMQKIVLDAGYWNGFPQIHGLLPMTCVGEIHSDAPPTKPMKTVGEDVVLEPGMVFSYEAGAKRGKGFMAAEVRVGGTGVVTEDGFEMFNTLGTRLQHLS